MVESKQTLRFHHSAAVTDPKRKLGPSKYSCGILNNCYDSNLNFGRYTIKSGSNYLPDGQSFGARRSAQEAR
jgi:predicted component of type VI protein secretion system